MAPLEGESRWCESSHADMKKCEHCSKEHDGSYASGRFCNNKCARAFSTKAKRAEINKKVSKTLTKHGKYTGRKGSPFCLCCGEVNNNCYSNYCSVRCGNYYRYLI